MNKNAVIVYVEDDSKSQMVVSVILSKRMNIGQLVVFDDSEDFLPRMEAVAPVPNLILLDIHVKPLNGFAMLNVLRGVPRFKQVPVVALTASVMNEEIQLLKNAGFDGCLAKPINLTTFPQHIERLLKGERVWAIV